MCARGGSRGVRGGGGGGDVVVVNVAIAVVLGIVVVAILDLIIGYLVVPLGFPLPNGKRPEAEHCESLCDE